MGPTKFLLDEKSLPESWYNIVPDLPFELAPPLNPATREPVGPLPRPPPGESPRHPRPHLLQVRGRLADGQPQAEHRRPPGLLQRAGGREAPHHRNRRRAVGLFFGLCLPPDGPR